MKKEISICWFRRDLRLSDNVAFFHALKGPYPVLPLFILDKNILAQLPSKKDKRVAFFYQVLVRMNEELRRNNSSLLVVHDEPLAAFTRLADEYAIKIVFTNHDYEPYAITRDEGIDKFLKEKQIAFNTYKDQVIFEKDEVMKPGGDPYTVFTPYANAWKKKLAEQEPVVYENEKLFGNLLREQPFQLPALAETGFEELPTIPAEPVISTDIIRHYHETRNLPAVDGTTQLSTHLRFGTVSVRRLVNIARQLNEQWLNELIWREFFMMILFHFPHVVNHSFKKKYDAIKWRNNEKEFELWCRGETGYAIVDAGMRQLNETGWMHNRVRMVVASFLTKHLLIDWRWGEAYFAEKLLDYELASNNGNWQWAAGSGCDAAPYFRIFNPSEQVRKFDPDFKYIKTWIKDFHPGYLQPVVEHEFARKRALEVYKSSLNE